MFKTSFWAVLFLTFLTACGSSGCYEATDVTLYCLFYSDSKNDTVSLSKTSVWGVGSDSLIYDNTSIAELALELNPDSTTTRFVISMQTDTTDLVDTVTFIYHNKAWFASMDCNCLTFSTLDTCINTGIIFTSIDIKNHTVDNTETTHVVLHTN
jgi:hypothetical protein